MGYKHERWDVVAPCPDGTRQVLETRRTQAAAYRALWERERIAREELGQPYLGLVVELAPAAPPPPPRVSSREGRYRQPLQLSLALETLEGLLELADGDDRRRSAVVDQLVSAALMARRAQPMPPAPSLELPAPVPLPRGPRRATKRRRGHAPPPPEHCIANGADHACPTPERCACTCYCATCTIERG